MDEWTQVLVWVAGSQWGKGKGIRNLTFDSEVHLIPDTINPLLMWHSYGWLTFIKVIFEHNVFALPKYNTAGKIASSVSHNWMRQVHSFHILMSNWDVRRSRQSSGMIASESLIENHSHSQTAVKKGNRDWPLAAPEESATAAASFFTHMHLQWWNLRPANETEWETHDGFTGRRHRVHR